MARLDFNLFGFRFQVGVKRLARGYAMAACALAQDVDQLRTDLATYEVQVAAGGERIGEWEDGVRLWERNDILRLQIEDAEAALMELRKAYALAGYHHWERGAKAWTQSPKGSHTELVAGSLALGYPIDPGLAGVRDLANTLKHNSTPKARLLAASWGELLQIDPHAVTEWDWHAAIELTDAHLARVFAILGQSGPRARDDLSFGGIAEALTEGAANG